MESIWLVTFVAGTYPLHLSAYYVWSDIEDLFSIYSENDYTFFELRTLH